MIDSPYHPYSDARFTVNERGTDDMDEELKKKGSSGSSKKAAAAKDEELE